MSAADLSFWDPLPLKVLSMIQHHCSDWFRDSWWPRLTDPGEDLSQYGLTSASSKFRGLPWKSEAHPRPECPQCRPSSSRQSRIPDIKMTLICQLMIKDAPDGLFGPAFLDGGMFQCFVCTNCYDHGECRVITARELEENGYFSLEQQSCRVKLFQNED